MSCATVSHRNGKNKAFTMPLKVQLDLNRKGQIRKDHISDEMNFKCCQCFHSDSETHSLKLCK